MGNLGNKKTMSKNLKKYLKLYNVSRMQLSESLDISYSTISDWINGNAYPRIDKIEMMANYFGINKSDLVEENYNNETSALRIPVLGNVAAGIPITAVEDILDYEEVPISWQSQGEFFALRIKGDSMESDINDGDTVIVKQQSDANNGDTVIALVNGDDATCKRLQKLDNGIMLVSNNSKYPPMYFSKEEIVSKPVVIIGKVIELRRKF
jgi:repressor LexA|nr:MAG TPA: Repressor protein CI [Caudoviricetes sp.]